MALQHRHITLLVKYFYNAMSLCFDASTNDRDSARPHRGPATKLRQNRSPSVKEAPPEMRLRQR